MGDAANNPIVPFKIDYINSDDESNRFTADTIKCTEAYEDSYACSCVDCEESCPAVDPPEADDPGYLIFDLNGTAFIVAVGIGSFGVVALIFGSVVGRNVHLSNLPQFFGGFNHADKWLTRFFRWWGRSE